jgi:class 3 adenylate cyclase
MGMKDDIKLKVKELLDTGEYSIYESTTIPGPGDTRLTFGNTGVRFPAVTLYIDMRGSTAVLNAHRAHNVAKIHKAYLFLATKLIAAKGGQIRSYNGDSILAFFPGEGAAEVEKAVRCAMEIKFMLQETASEFKKYREVDFGIGIDVGKVLCVKAGMGRNDNHNDLIWLGNAVNRATVLSDKAKDPKNIWISDPVYKLLPLSLLEGGTPKTLVWLKEQALYNDAVDGAWSTLFHCAVS